LKVVKAGLASSLEVLPCLDVVCEETGAARAMEVGQGVTLWCWKLVHVHFEKVAELKKGRTRIFESDMFEGDAIAGLLEVVAGLDDGSGGLDVGWQFSDGELRGEQVEVPLEQGLLGATDEGETMVAQRVDAEEAGDVNQGVDLGRRGFEVQSLFAGGAKKELVSDDLLIGGENGLPCSKAGSFEIARLR